MNHSSLVFGAYSHYYDLLYRDKDYQREVQYVLGLLSRFHSGVVSVLELGCGTGRHASMLGEAGVDVIGVERSESMLTAALVRATDMKHQGVSGSFEPLLGDVTTFRADKTFDAVLSLFHVVSYQTSNDDISEMFKTASSHLQVGGIFLFDMWYGPAVLSQRPSVRVKRLEDDKANVIRIAEPELNVNENRVDVHYTILFTDKSTGSVQITDETHSMRYYFLPELETLASGHGLKIVHREEWLTGVAPSVDTWSVCIVATREK